MSTLEKSYRVTARGFYVRWLAQRFGNIDFLQTKEGEEKVHLARIYIAARLDHEDRRDEDMGKDKTSGGAKDEETPPGRDAREVIAETPFVAISGRPGSGKTTLVHALIHELCAGPETPFRRNLVGHTGILPVPLILRDYQDELPRLTHFEELLDLWWQRALEEARDKGFTLHIERLRRSVAPAPTGDGMPMLVFFDGIDEVGGVDPRGRVLAMAREAREQGHRVVLTGRPSGFEGLKFIAPPDDGVRLGAALDTHGGVLLPTIHHIQPFARPQIGEFLALFYRLSDEWKRIREQSIAEFNDALDQRDYLLVLARRPIFLTLMALVHANDRRMPHGRADLYRRIIDLYLIRQTHQRRLQHTTDGRPMPHWDEREVRRALGFIAWCSQQRGAEAEGSHNRDRRQVVWSREELEAEVSRLLGGEDPDLGRFRELMPSSTQKLIDYFLHPAGLLVEPADKRIQFAHLSFQEYLCAEYLHGRTVAGGSSYFIEETRKLLLDRLASPGWDEIAMLFLTIHTAQGAQTQGTAHLEVLAELDIAKVAEARLLIAALTGQELDFEQAEHRRWLPVAVAAALLHPRKGFARRFGEVTAWSSVGWAKPRSDVPILQQGPGLKLLIELLRGNDPWPVLQEILEGDPPGGRRPKEWRERGLGKAAGRWQNPTDDESWDVDGKFGSKDARRDDAHSSALLITIADAAWGLAGKDEETDPLRLDMDAGLQSALSDWLRRTNPPLYHMDESATEPLPEPTYMGLALDALVPARGELWFDALARVPLEAWLLQGEGWDEGYFLWDTFSQPMVLLALYPDTPPPPLLV